MDTGRLDNTIAQLERLQKVATDIIDAHVSARVCQMLPGTSFGAAKAAYLFPQAGSELNYVAALKFIRRECLK